MKLKISLFKDINTPLDIKGYKDREFEVGYTKNGILCNKKVINFPKLTGNIKITYCTIFDKTGIIASGYLTHPIIINTKANIVPKFAKEAVTFTK